MGEEREKSRLEEEQDKLDKENVENFKRMKTSSRKEVQVESSQVEEHARQTNLYLQYGKADQIQYETDEEEFEIGDLQTRLATCHEEEPSPKPSQEDGTCQALGGYATNLVGGAPHQQINTRVSGQSSLQVNIDESSKV